MTAGADCEIFAVNGRSASRLPPQHVPSLPSQYHGIVQTNHVIYQNYLLHFFQSSSHFTSFFRPIFKCNLNVFSVTCNMYAVTCGICQNTVLTSVHLVWEQCAPFSRARFRGSNIHILEGPEARGNGPLTIAVTGPTHVVRGPDFWGPWRTRGKYNYQEFINEIVWENHQG